MSLISFSDRVRTYNSIYNFRDFGGYEGLDGAPVVTGKLFRSAHLNNLTDADHEDISGLGLDLIIDLRHAPERARQPSRLPKPHPAVFEFPDPPEARGDKVAPHEAFMQNDLNTADDSRQYMMGSYTARPHDVGFQTIFADTIRYMSGSESDPAILVHCAAGKDRTGTLCALIQGLLGVSREDIMTDFMLTMTAVDIDNIIVPAAEMFTQRYGRPIDAEALRPMFGVEPQYLEAALNGIGDFETYATTTLGLGHDDLRALRETYLSR